MRQGNMAKKIARVQGGVVEGIYIYPDDFDPSVDPELVDVGTSREAMIGGTYDGSVFTRVPAVQTPAEEVKAILVDQTLEDLKAKALDDLINAQMTVTRADLEAMSDVDLRAARDTARADAESIDRSSPASRRR